MSQYYVLLRCSMPHIIHRSMPELTLDKGLFEPFLLQVMLLMSSKSLVMLFSSTYFQPQLCCLHKPASPTSQCLHCLESGSLEGDSEMRILGQVIYSGSTLKRKTCKEVKKAGYSWGRSQAKMRFLLNLTSAWSQGKLWCMNGTTEFSHTEAKRLGIGAPSWINWLWAVGGGVEQGTTFQVLLSKA